MTVGIDIGPVSSQAQVEQDLNYVGIGQAEGTVLVTGGQRVVCSTKGFYMVPTLLTDTTSTMRINREEVFGPVAGFVALRTGGREEASLAFI